MKDRSEAAADYNFLEDEWWGDSTKPEPSDRAMGVAAVLKALRGLDSTVAELKNEIGDMRKMNQATGIALVGVASAIHGLRRLVAWLAVSAAALAIVGLVIRWATK